MPIHLRRAKTGGGAVLRSVANQSGGAVEADSSMMEVGFGVAAVADNGEMQGSADGGAGLW